ncbi:MAG: hypothetical protein K2N64_03450 [Anaeroplasmataceae bacterium]|nr:hypothetical protein [Anaeroplasmataceae bacterium]
MPKHYFDVEIEESYPVDEDIEVKISIGLCKDYQENFSKLEGLEYKLGCFLEATKYESEIASFYTIKDFTDDRYYYTETEDEIIYNFSEWFTLNKEIFDNEQGDFWIVLYQTIQLEGVNGISYGVWQRFVYKKQDERLYLQNKYEGDYDAE